MTRDGVSLETTLTTVVSSLGLTTAIGATILIARLYSISGMDGPTAASLAGHADFGSLLFVLFVSIFPTLVGLIWAAFIVVATDLFVAARPDNAMLRLGIWIGAVGISALVPFQWGTMAAPIAALIYCATARASRRKGRPWSKLTTAAVRGVALVVVGASAINAIFLNERPLGQGVTVALSNEKDRTRSDGSVVGYILSSNSDSITLLQHRPRQVLLLRPTDLADIDACRAYRGSADKTLLQHLVDWTGGGSSRISGSNAPFCFPQDIP